jgi:hypothetical protein
VNSYLKMRMRKSSPRNLRGKPTWNENFAQWMGATPTSSHQPPIDKRKMYLNIMSNAPRDRMKRCKGRQKKILPEGRNEERVTDRGWRFCFEAGEANP